MPGEVILVGGHTAFIIPAKANSATKAKPWVWYSPTLPGLPGKEEQWMFEQLLGAGIAIAGIDVGESFGSPAGRKLFTSFHTEMTDSRGYSQRPVLLGLVAAFDGKRWRPANDPQPGASGGAGSFIPPFGDGIAEKFRVPVGVVACGVGATSVREWLPKGATFPNPPTLTGQVRQLPSGGWESQGAIFASFTSRLKSLGPRGFRAVLWHQGESDANQRDATRTLPGSLYRECMEKLIHSSRREIGWVEKVAPWLETKR